MKVEKYYQPVNIKELLELLQANNGAMKIIAGGTDVIVSIRNRKIRPDALVDIGRIKQMHGITLEYGKMTIGSTTTFREIAENKMILKYVPMLAEAASQVGSPQIRCLGTIGGNVANCAAAGDSIPVLLALQAKAIVADQTGERLVCVSKLLKDVNTSSLSPKEVVLGFVIDITRKRNFQYFRKLGPRKALAISNLSLAVSADVEDNIIKDIHIAAGAVGRTAYCVDEIEQNLVGKDIKNLDSENEAQKFGKYIYEQLGGREEVPYKAGYKKNLAVAALSSCICEMKGGCGNE